MGQGPRKPQQHHRRAGYGEVDFEAFEQASGTKIAAATRQGLCRLWRTKAPTFKENEPNSTFHISAAGLQGLHLEFAEGKALPTLTDAEVRRALRYALIEINGYLRVIGIDATTPEDFRAAAKKSRSKKGVPTRTMKKKA